MSKTHWKKLNNPDYLGAYALEPGQDLIATIKAVRKEMVTGADGKKEECTVVHFEEKDIKPLILNSTNAKTIQKLYKTPYIEEWQGRKIQLYVETVRAFGEMVEALRIRPSIPKITGPVSSEPVMCADCGAEVSAFGKMNAAQMADYTYSKYGKSLCSECAKVQAEKLAAVEVKNPLAKEEEPNEDNEN